MTGDRVLPRRGFRHPATCANRLGLEVETIDGRNSGQAKSAEIRNPQRDVSRDVSQRVAARVAIIGSIG